MVESNAGNKIVFLSVFIGVHPWLFSFFPHQSVNPAEQTP